MKTTRRTAVLALLALALLVPTAHGQAGNGRGSCLAQVSVSYYKTPPGRQDEWLALYKKWHRPIIEYELAHGALVRSQLFAAGTHSPGQPWDFAIISVSPPANQAKPLGLGRADLIRKLFPDIAAYTAGEKARWELTINHWDEDLVEMNLDEPLSVYAPVDGGCKPH